MALPSLVLSTGHPRHLCRRQDAWPPEEILLVELDNEACLDKLAENGATFKCAGRKRDAVVLCLLDQTFHCKHVETTNALLLVDISEEGLIMKENVANMTKMVSGQVQESAKDAYGLLSQMRADNAADSNVAVTIVAESSFIVETGPKAAPLGEVNAALCRHHLTLDSVSGGTPCAAGGLLDESTWNYSPGLDGTTAGAYSWKAQGLPWQELRSTVMACDAHIVDALDTLGALALPSGGAHGLQMPGNGVLRAPASSLYSDKPAPCGPYVGQLEETAEPMEDDSHSKPCMPAGLDTLAGSSSHGSAAELGAPSACDIHWVYMAPEFIGEALELLLLTCIEHSMALSELSADALLAVLQSDDPLAQALIRDGGHLGHHVLRRFCKVAGSERAIRHAVFRTDEADPAPEPITPGLRLHFDRQLVARQLARLAILRVARDTGVREDTPSGTVLGYGPVFHQWRDLMPSARVWPPESSTQAAGAAAAFAQALSGVALIRGTAPADGSEAELMVVLEESLPMEAAPRFAALFALKSCWTAEELAPYLERAFDAACRSPAELLHSHTRTCRVAPDAVPEHCERR